MDHSPGVRWTDIAGLADGKRVLEEAAVLPLMMPEYFTGIRKPVKVCIGLSEGARGRGRHVLEEVAVLALMVPEYFTGIQACQGACAGGGSSAGPHGAGIHKPVIVSVDLGESA
eukprot:1156781-Pelagomonas_calceolata.AAC.2